MYGRELRDKNVIDFFGQMKSLTTLFPSTVPTRNTHTPPIACLSISPHAHGRDLRIAGRSRATGPRGGWIRPGQRSRARSTRLEREASPAFCIGGKSRGARRPSSRKSAPNTMDSPIRIKIPGHQRPPMKKKASRNNQKKPPNGIHEGCILGPCLYRLCLCMWVSFTSKSYS